MENSIFLDKNSIPNKDDLSVSLGDTYDLWQTLVDYVHLKYPDSMDEWNFSKNGWSFRIKDKKRVIIYLLPRDKYFKVAFVFGQKATEIIMQSQMNEVIKTELSSAKVYAEGRGIRIDIKNIMMISDIKELIAIKLAH